MSRLNPEVSVEQEERIPNQAGALDQWNSGVNKFLGLRRMAITAYNVGHVLEYFDEPIIVKFQEHLIQTGFATKELEPDGKVGRETRSSIQNLWEAAGRPGNPI